MGIKDYTIIDLPFTAVSQANFLMRTLGEDNIVLHGEGDVLPSPKVKLFRPTAFLESNERYDLVVNVDSITEIDRSVADAYWSQIKKRAPIFLSINHEANVFTAMELGEADMDSIDRHQRYPYGLRKGYAEETFWFKPTN
jgi:hypothetical protein